MVRAKVYHNASGKLLSYKSLPMEHNGQQIHLFIHITQNNRHKSKDQPNNKMAFKFLALCALIAVAKAGIIGAPAAYATGPAIAPVAYSAAPAVSHVSYSSPFVSYGAPTIAAPAITSQSQNILRTYGNLGQVSTYSKSIDTPFSSVRKSDVRISNPGLKIATAPAIAATYAQPIATQHIIAAPQPSAPIGVAYSAAPAVAHVTYSNGYGWNYAY